MDFVTKKLPGGDWLAVAGRKVSSCFAGCFTELEKQSWQSPGLWFGQTYSWRRRSKYRWILVVLARNALTVRKSRRTSVRPR